MKRTFSALVISGALLCTLAVPGMAAEAEGQPGASAAASAPQAQTLPASVLYFGQVTQVIRDEAGTVTRLVLSSCLLYTSLQVLRDRGIRVEELPEGFRVPGGQQYGRGTLGEEADYSQAAFWLAAAGLGSPLTVEGLDPDSCLLYTSPLLTFSRPWRVWGRGKWTCAAPPAWGSCPSRRSRRPPRQTSEAGPDRCWCGPCLFYTSSCV